MSHYKYLIIGGGMTAHAAARAIRKQDSHGSLGFVSSELVAPYNRPPLTKDLWKGKDLESIWLKTDDLDATFHLGRVIQSIDVEKKCVTDDGGQVYSFEKLLLATGGTPRRFSFGGERIIYFRTVQDYHRLRALTERAERFAVIGGGFIGSEIAAALAMSGKQVHMIFPESTIGARTFPHDVGLFLNQYYRQKGVEVYPQVSVTAIKQEGEIIWVHLEHGLPLQVDAVVAGLGIEPNVDLARDAGLQVGEGILVDEFLCTNYPDIYAAGDVASFYNPMLGKRLRVEHEDNARTMGKIAGRNMAGEHIPYLHLPFFYSDLFELGYEAVGDVNAKLQTFADWQDPYRKGVIYYLEDQRVRGVLLWNVSHQLDNARKLIAEAGPLRPEDLKDRLSERFFSLL